MTSKIHIKFQQITMRTLYQIYDKFLTLCKSLCLCQQREKNKNFVHIAISLSATDPILVDCRLPDISSKTIEEITELAEKYGLALSNLTAEDFEKQLFDAIYLKKDKHNYKNILFIDNIVSFWEMYRAINYKKLYNKYYSDQPLVKPTEVFITK